MLHMEEDPIEMKSNRSTTQLNCLARSPDDEAAASPTSPQTDMICSIALANSLSWIARWRNSLFQTGFVFRTNRRSHSWGPAARASLC